MAKARTPSKSPSVIVELVESDGDTDLNNNPLDDSQRLFPSPFRYTGRRRFALTDEDFKSTRRKSSASRYGFDEAFIELVAKQCQLVLETENVLGRGSFGTVVAANYQGVEVAAKIVDIKGKRQSYSVKNEENGLELTGHPHVVNVLDIFRLGLNTAIIILPRLRKGNLLTILNKGPPPTINRVIVLATQIVSAISFCHSHDLLHLDIKPQNILIDFQENIRLCDFGNSRKLDDLHCYSTITLDGTVAYKAPELFCGQFPSKKADVYSFGVTLWQILVRETPYLGFNDHTIIYKVVAEKLRPCWTQGESYKDDFLYWKLRSIVTSCWDQDPANRPEIESVAAQLEFETNSQASQCIGSLN